MLLACASSENIRNFCSAKIRNTVLLDILMSCPAKGNEDRSSGMEEKEGKRPADGFGLAPDQGQGRFGRKATATLYLLPHRSDRKSGIPKPSVFGSGIIAPSFSLQPPAPSPLGTSRSTPLRPPSTPCPEPQGQSAQSSATCPHCTASTK